jgi:hypothetical protein
VDADAEMTDGSRSIPVAAFAIRGSLVIGTDAGEWSTLGADDQLVPLPATGPVSAAIEDASGTLTVACWEPRLEQLDDPSRAWSEIALGAPAVALAATPRGLVIADTSGGLSLLAGGAHLPVHVLTAPEPVVALQPMEQGLVVLAASGAVEVTTWPGHDGPLAPVSTASIGRAHALFPGIRRGTVLVAGARGLGVLEQKRLVAVTTDLGDRIGGAAVFADHGRAFVYADDGEAWIVDDALGRPARVRLGDAEVAGCVPGPDGTVLVWTTEGVLYVVGHDGASWRIADGGVVLAAPEVGRIGSIAIHWTPLGGARVTRGHVAWN